MLVHALGVEQVATANLRAGRKISHVLRHGPRTRKNAASDLGTLEGCGGRWKPWSDRDVGERMTRVPHGGEEPVVPHALGATGGGSRGP